MVTKALVAHAGLRPESFGIPYGPEDGAEIGVPAPCARLVAGYWCACGSGSVSTVTQEPTFRARVVGAEDGRWQGYVDDGFDSEGFLEQPVHRPGVADRRALQRTTETLEVGTVVERRGVSVAPAFGWTTTPSWTSSGDSTDPPAPVRPC